MSTIINTIDITHVRGTSDLKKYRIIKLSSGLEALLISTEHLINNNDNISLDSLKAAASMSVQVGSFADPEKAGGLAHFLEHMVFMGSTKYPDENYYDSFVSSHNGSCNAMTEGEYTVYQFDISANYFPQGLDIFANCFISPLLSFSSVNREIKSIDSEFHLAKVDDENCLQQLICDSSSKNHVLKKFSWGNKKSLIDIPNKCNIDMKQLLTNFHQLHYKPSNMKLAVIAPKSLDELQSDVMNSFSDWESNSSPNASIKKKLKKNDNMKLLTLHDSIKHLQNKLPIPKSNMNKIYRIKSNKRSHTIVLTWQLPPVIALYNTKPTGYISHLLGHEGKGSILSVLKSLNYANYLSAGLSGSNFDDNTMFSIFSITIKLTNIGLANWIHVVKIINEYLLMLQNSEPEKWVHDEIKSLDQIKYNYMNEIDEEDLVENFAISMLPFYNIAREDLLFANYITSVWDPQAIKNIINMLAITNSRIDILSPYYNNNFCNVSDSESEGESEEEEDSSDELEDSENDSDEESSIQSTSNNINDIDISAFQSLYIGPANILNLIIPSDSKPNIEPYFKSKYWVNSIPNELYNYWNNQSINSNFQSYYAFEDKYQLELPTKNPYIPENLDIINDMVVMSEPKQICHSNKLNVWYMNDSHRFQLPKCIVYVKLLYNISDYNIDSDTTATSTTSKELDNKILSVILHDLIIRLLKDYINESVYQASLCDIQCNINSYNDNGILIKLSGFNDKIYELLNYILETFSTPLIYLSNQSIIQRELELLIKEYENHYITSESIAYISRLDHLCYNRIPYDSRVDYYQNRFNDKNTSRLIIEFSKFILSNVHIDSYIHGNVNETVAHHLSNWLTNYLSNNITNDVSSLPIIKSNTISDTIKSHRFCFNNKETNRCIEIYFQIDNYNVYLLSILDLLDQIISEPFFDELRTKQQIGYSVSCGLRDTNGTLGFCFTIVSSSHDKTDINDAMFNYINNLSNYINNLDNEQYNKHIQSLISNKLNPEISLHDAGVYIWNEIDEKRFNFNRKQLQVQILQSNESLQLLDSLNCQPINQAHLSKFCHDYFISNNKRCLIIEVEPNNNKIN